MWVVLRMIDRNAPELLVNRIAAGPGSTASTSSGELGFAQLDVAVRRAGPVRVVALPPRRVGHPRRARGPALRRLLPPPRQRARGPPGRRGGRHGRAARVRPPRSPPHRGGDPRRARSRRAARRRRAPRHASTPRLGALLRDDGRRRPPVREGPRGGRAGGRPDVPRLPLPAPQGRRRRPAVLLAAPDGRARGAGVARRARHRRAHARACAASSRSASTR